MHVRTVKAHLDREKMFVFPDLRVTANEEERAWSSGTRITCSCCQKSRAILPKQRKNLEKKSFTCERLQGCSCDTPEDDLVRSVRRGAPRGPRKIDEKDIVAAAAFGDLEGDDCRRLFAYLADLPRGADAPASGRTHARSR